MDSGDLSHDDRLPKFLSISAVTKCNKAREYKYKCHVFIYKIKYFVSCNKWN